MSTAHAPADDVVYDLVSIQYHALKGAELHDKYMQDAHDHAEVAEFIQQIREEDQQRAERCHELLAMLTKDHGLKSEVA
jgi:putative heme degradation protein